MRVLHVVSTARRRGAEVFADDLVRLLSEEGIDQRVAVLWAAPASDLFSSAPVVALGPGVLTGIAGWRERVGALRRETAAWAPHVVQVHGGDALEHAVLADVMGRTPVVYRNIGMASPSITRGARRRAYRLLMRRPAKVIAVAEVVAAETTATFRVPPGRVVTIPNGVDADRLRPLVDRRVLRASLGIPDAAPVALSVGALSWEKDPLAQVEVAARVLAARPEGYVVMAGDGPLRPEVESMVAGRGLEGRVLLLGSRRDVADLLAAADLLLFASRSGGMEGMPAILIEAGMAGVPVVAYGVAGVSEVVRHGLTGLLVAPADVDGLASSILQLFADGPERTELGRCARARCVERFELRGHLGAYLSVYAEVTGAAGR